LCRADKTENGSSGASALGPDNDLVFLAKLTAISFGGGALIKYGSLVIPVAFHPDAAIACLLVIGTPVVYGLNLLRSDKA